MTLTEALQQLGLSTVPNNEQELIDVYRRKVNALKMQAGMAPGSAKDKHLTQIKVVEKAKDVVLPEIKRRPGPIPSPKPPRPVPVPPKPGPKPPVPIPRPIPPAPTPRPGPKPPITPRPRRITAWFYFVWKAIEICGHAIFVSIQTIVTVMGDIVVFVLSNLFSALNHVIRLLPPKLEDAVNIIVKVLAAFLSFIWQVIVSLFRILLAVVTVSARYTAITVLALGRLLHALSIPLKRLSLQGVHAVARHPDIVAAAILITASVSGVSYGVWWWNYARPASVQFETWPAAKIIVDDKEIGEAPGPSSFSIEKGSRAIRITPKNGCTTLFFTADFLPGQGYTVKINQNTRTYNIEEKK